MKYLDIVLSFVLLISFSFLGLSQCDINITLPNDISICEPSSLTIDANVSGNFSSVQWSDQSGVFEPNALSINQNFNSNTEIFVDVISQTITNSLVNGSFEDGNIGFSSDYTFDGNTQDLISGRYTITTNPGNIHPAFAECMADDGGNIMVINGSGNSADRIWCQTINTIPNVEYTFMAKAQALATQNLAELQFSVNGVLIGNDFPLVGPLFGFLCLGWIDFQASWTPPSIPSTAEICITNQNTNEGGNDFAIDDIFFGTNCFATDTINIFLSDVSIDVENGMVDCDFPLDTIHTFISTAYDDISFQYNWDNASGNIEGSTSADSLIVSAPGTYFGTLTDSWGCEYPMQSVIDGNFNSPTFDVVADPLFIGCDPSSSTITISNLSTQAVNVSLLLSGNVVQTGFGPFTVFTPGKYSIEVTELANPCLTTTLPVEILDQTALPVFDYIIEKDVQCNTYQCIIQDLTPVSNYNIEWSPNVASFTDEVAMNLVPDDYSITITNQYGCADIIDFTITLPAFSSFYLLNAEDINCTNNGIIIDFSTNPSFPNEYSSTIVTENGEAYTEGSLTDVGGWYYLSLYDSDYNCIVHTDSINILDNRVYPMLNLTLDTIDCLDDTANLLVDNLGTITTIEWSDQNGTVVSNDFSFNTIQPGIFTVAISNLEGCSTDSTFQVDLFENQISSITPILTLPLCGSTTGSITEAFLSGVEPPFQLFLDDNEITLPITIDTGLHTIVVFDKYGCSKDTSFYLPYITPLELSGQSVYDLLFGESVSIDIKTNRIDNTNLNIDWETHENFSCTDCLNPIITPINTGTYSITVQDSMGCTSMYSITINVEKDFNVFIPNIFNPTSSNENQLFSIQGNAALKTIHHFEIYDRWGNTVFQSKDQLLSNGNAGWDGTFNNKDCPQGVYVFMVDLEWADGNREIRTGDLTLIR